MFITDPSGEEEAKLADVVSAFCCAGPEQEVRRTVSKSSLSPRRKKTKLHPQPVAKATDEVAALIERLEEYSDQLFEAVIAADGGCPLSEEQARRLAAVSHKIAAILPVAGS